MHGFTFFVRVHSVISIELLMSLLLVNGFAENGVLVYDVHRLFLLLATASLRRHRCHVSGRDVTCVFLRVVSKFRFHGNFSIVPISHIPLL